MNSSHHDLVTEELLSAYIDDAVTPRERALVEAAVAEDAELAWRLETLRHTVALLRQLPELQTPRSFALTQAMAVEAIPAPAAAGRPRAEAPAAGASFWQAVLDFFQTGSPLMRNFAAASLTAFLVLVAMGAAFDEPVISGAAQPAPPVSVANLQLVDQAADTQENAPGSATLVALKPAEGEAGEAPASAESAPVDARSAMPGDSDEAELDAPAAAPAAAIMQAPAAEEPAVMAAEMVESEPAAAARAFELDAPAPPAEEAAAVLESGPSSAAGSSTAPMAAASMEEEPAAAPATAPATAPAAAPAVAPETAGEQFDSAGNQTAPEIPAEPELTGADRAPLWYVQMISLALAGLFAALWLISRRNYAPAI
jgi:anti-sigma factor RsiW